MTDEFRFSFNVFGVSSGSAFRDLCRRGEAAGYDAVFAADHLGAPAPFPVLVAAAAADLVTRFPGTMTVEDALETSYLLIGTPAQMAAQLLESRQRYGFSHITVHEPYREAFEPVIALLR